MEFKDFYFMFALNLEKYIESYRKFIAQVFLDFQFGLFFLD